MKRIQQKIGIFLILSITISCSQEPAEDWSFLELINLPLILEADCKLRIYEDVAPPQFCYAQVGAIDFYQWENKKILSIDEIESLKEKISKSVQQQIPQSVVEEYTKYLTQEEFKKLSPSGNEDILYEKYEVSNFARLSSPIWIHENLILLFVNNYDRNEFGSGGEMLIFRKLQSKWKIIYRLNTWVS